MALFINGHINDFSITSLLGLVDLINAPFYDIVVVVVYIWIRYGNTTQSFRLDANGFVKWHE